jgi:hypothetical protein
LLGITGSEVGLRGVLIGTVSACWDSAASGRTGPEAKRAVGSAGPKIRKKEISELKLDFWFYQGFGNL